MAIREGAQNLTIAEFLAMDVPDNVKPLDEKECQNFTGSHTAKHNKLKNEHGIWIDDLAPVFGKMDVLRISTEIEESGQQLKSVNKEDVLNASDLNSLYQAGSDISYAQTQIGDNLADWRLAQWLFGECHETLFSTYNIWVPEVEEVFVKLDDLMGSA